MGVQPAPGRQVPGRLTAHGGRRHRDVQPQRGSGRRRERPLGVQGRPQGGQHQGGERWQDRRLLPRRPDRRVPVPLQQHDLPDDHPAVDLQDRPVREGRDDDGRLPARVVHAGRRRQVRPQPGLVGRLDAARRRRRDVLLRRRGGDRGAPRRPDRPDQPGLVLGQSGALRQLEGADHLGQGHPAPRDLDARLDGRCDQAVQGPARSAGTRAHARPAGDHQAAVQRASQSRATTRRSPRSTRRPIRRFRSASRISCRRRSCWRRPATPRASR